jgi:hypothetical protein
LHKVAVKSSAGSSDAHKRWTARLGSPIRDWVNWLWLFHGVDWLRPQGRAERFCEMLIWLILAAGLKGDTNHFIISARSGNADEC